LRAVGPLADGTPLAPPSASMFSVSSVLSDADSLDRLTLRD
jgi:hypothetical protein